MTQLYGHTREIPGYYQDVRAVNHLDAVFARYYTDAYYAWQDGNRAAVPRSWQIALDAARDKRVSGNGDLLLGMNAHINRDLPFVLAATGLVAPGRVEPQGRLRRRRAVALRRHRTADRGVRGTLRPGDGRLGRPVRPRQRGAVPDGLGAGARTRGATPRRWCWRRTPPPGAWSRPPSRRRPTSSRRASCAGTSYLPLLSSTRPRDSFCATHQGDAPPLAYDFGLADAFGYRYD